MKNPKWVAALRAAKKQLSNTGRDIENRYICVALSETKVGCAVSLEIIRRLDGMTVRTWLYRNLPESRHGEITDERVQAHRHAWVDQLIKEFS
jgi:hypothetical protein